MVSTFLSDVEAKCFKQNSDNDELCFLGINKHNSSGYFEIGFSGILIALVLLLAKYHEIKQFLPEKQAADLLGVKLRQVKPFRIVSEISVVCFFSSFAMFSLQSSTEAILPQLTKYYFGFGTVENSYVYGIAGGSAIFGFFGMIFDIN